MTQQSIMGGSEYFKGLG